MWSRGLKLALCLSVVCMLTGCWDRVEVEKLGIVLGLGIDKIPGPQPILITVQIVQPQGKEEKGDGSAGGTKFIHMSAKGRSVLDAIRNFSKDSPRRLHFAHTSVIIIGHEMARSGIDMILDYFERDPDFRQTAWILVSTAPAKEILSVPLKLENIPSSGIEGMIEEFSQSSESAVVQQKDFVKAVTSKSESAVASRMLLVDTEAEADELLKEAEGEDVQASGGSGDGKTQKNLRLSGTAVFHEDKLIGYLNAKESRGLLWLNGHLKGGAVLIPCKEESKKVISFRIERTQSKLKVYKKDGEVAVHVIIEAETSISEVMCTDVDIGNPATIKQLEQLQNKEIEDRITKTIKKSQKFRSDIVGFGEAIHRKYPRIWKKELEPDWGTAFSDINFDVQVTSKIRRIGMTAKAVKLEE